MTPTGTIKTPGIDANWEDITRYDDLIHAAADPVGWPIERVRGTIAIESAGDPKAIQRNEDNGWSYGLMQPVPYGIGWDGWHALIRQIAGLPANASRQKVINALYDPAINIAVGVAILEQLYQQYGTLDAASSAFFTGNGTWSGPGDSENQNTPAWYRKTLNALIAEQEAAEPAASVTEQDLLNLISNNTPGVYVSFGFNQLNTGGGDFYRYGKGHGTNGNNMHPGIDIWMPDETPVNAVFGGEVVCVGSQGRVVWDQGCGYFSDDDGGLGNITILTDAYATIGGKQYQLKTTYGHMSAANVRVGQRIANGERIGRSGVGNNWPHVHLDVSINAPELNNPQIWNNPGAYHLVDPLPTMLNALGGGEITPPKAERLPIPQPEEFETSVTVTVTADELPVLQRADVTGAVVADPLVKGDTFEAVYQVVGNDGRIYWVSTRGGRVPVEGTTAAGWVAPTAGAPGTDTEAVADLIEGVRAEVDTRLREVIASLSAA